jgi:hypothetical protein
MGVLERWNFFSTCSRIRKYSALPITGVSLLLLVMMVQSILNPTQPFLPKPFPIAAGFSIGILNIFSGLLLLTKE